MKPEKGGKWVLNRTWSQIGKKSWLQNQFKGKNGKFKVPKINN